jgi:malate dehydrogenase
MTDMIRKKVTVVGAGFVGASTAMALAQQNLTDVVLTDIIEGMPQGKALDIREAGPMIGSDAEVIGTNNYVDTQGSDIVVITAGLARKPGMSRDDLLNTNAKIVGGVTEEVFKHSPDAIFINVTNPLDAMAQIIFSKTKLPRSKVIGMAGCLDSTRMRTFISMELGISVENIHAFVLGGHGDTMVPLPRYATVSGVPITELMSEEQINRISDRTRKGGGEIVKLLGTGSAFYAPAASVCEMVEAILLDKKKILPCCVHLEGEFGIDGLFVGVPVILGAGGVEKVWELNLTDDEQAELNASAAAVQELVDILGI